MKHKSYYFTFLPEFIYLLPLGLRIKTKRLSVVHKAVCGRPLLTIYLHLPIPPCTLCSSRSEMPSFLAPLSKWPQMVWLNATEIYFLSQGGQNSVIKVVSRAGVSRGSEGESVCVHGGFWKSLTLLGSRPCPSSAQAFFPLGVSVGLSRSLCR